MVFLESYYFGVALIHYGFQKLLVVLSPLINRKFFNMDNAVPIWINLKNAFDFVIIILLFCNFSDESFVPRLQFREGGLFIQTIDYHLCNVSWVIIGDESTPTWPYPFASIDQTHWNYGNVVFRLNELSVVFDVGQSVVIRLGVNVPCHLIQISEDVSCTGVIFPSLVSGTKLTIGHQKIYIVWTYEVLGHVDDSHGQGHLAVVICWMLGHITG